MLDHNELKGCRQASAESRVEFPEGDVQEIVSAHVRPAM